MLTDRSIIFSGIKYFSLLNKLCCLVLVQLSNQKRKLYELTNSPKSNKTKIKI